MAGKVIRSVSAKFTADISDFEKKLRSMSKQMKQHGDKMKSFGTAWTKAVTAPMVAIGAAAVKMAMQTQESENLFNVSMGKMGDKARAWSEDLKKSLGLSAYELRKNVATLNSMITSMGLNEDAAFDMSTSLTKLSNDLASFYNISSDDALTKLKSGLMGEAEPMKQLGVLVNDTTIKSWALKKGLIAQGQEMTEQQKVVARYAVIMASTSKAQGDLARTMDSPTNRLRIMKGRVTDLAVDLGNKLMPAFTLLLDAATKAIIWVQGLADKFNALDEDTQKNILSMVGLAAVLGPVAIGIGQITVALSTMAASGALATLGKLGAAGAGVAAAWALIDNVNKDVKEQTGGQMGLGALIADNFKNGFGKRGSRYTPPSSATTASPGATATKTPSNYAAVYSRAADVYSKIRAKVDAAASKQSSLKSQNDMLNYFKQLGSETDKATSKVDTFTDSVRSMVQAIREQTKSFSNFVGLFDVFERKSVSGDRLLNRLKAQVKAMSEWRTNLAKLEKRGVSGELLNDLRAMGPSAVDSISALAGLSDSKLKEYVGAYGQKNSIAGGEASKLVAGQNKIETNIEKQIVLNVTGTKADGEAIAFAIVKKLRLAGYTI